MNAGVSLPLQQLLDFRFAEIGRDGYRKGQQQPRIAMRAGARAQLILNARGRIAAHRLSATPAMQHRGARKQQLQMIIEFGHGADGGA